MLNDRRLFLAKQRCNQAVQILGSLLRLNIQRSHNCPTDLRRYLCAHLQGAFQGIVVQPLQGAQRHLTRQSIIHGCANRVHIGPWPLLSVGLILFNGCKPLLYDDRQRLRCLHDGIARRAEVQKLDRTIREVHDIIRCNIAVDIAVLMEKFQRQNSRDHALQQLFFIHYAELRNVLLHGNPFQMLHHDVCCTVLFQDIVD